MVLLLLLNELLCAHADTEGHRKTTPDQIFEQKSKIENWLKQHVPEQKCLLGQRVSGPALFATLGDSGLFRMEGFKNLNGTSQRTHTHTS